jgi:hypothetical protein
MAKRKWHWRKTKANSTIHLPVFWLVLLVEFSGTTTQRNRSNRRVQRAGPNPAQGPAGWNRVVVNGTDCGFFQACGLPGCHFAGTSFPLRPGTRYPLALLVRKIVAITLPPGARAVAIGHRPVSTPPREHMQARSTQRGTPQQAVWGEWYAPYSRNEWHAQAQIRFRFHTPSVKQSCPRACEMMPHEPKAEPKAGGPVRAK